MKYRTDHLLFAIRDIPKDQITYIEKHLLTMILACSNHEGKSWYGQTKIADKSGLTRRTVNKLIKSLAEKSFIKYERRFKGNEKDTNMYSLNVTKIMKYCPVVGRERDSQPLENNILNPSEYDSTKVGNEILIKNERDDEGALPLPLNGGRTSSDRNGVGQKQAAPEKELSPEELEASIARSNAAREEFKAKYLNNYKEKSDDVRARNGSNA